MKAQITVLVYRNAGDVNDAGDALLQGISLQLLGWVQSDDALLTLRKA
jgi:hypothetical protein